MQYTTKFPLRTCKNWFCYIHKAYYTKANFGLKNRIVTPKSIKNKEGLMNSKNKSTLLNEKMKKAPEIDDLKNRNAYRSVNIENISSITPWNFTDRIKKSAEENLKTILPIEKLITHKQAILLFKDYAQSLEEQDFEHLKNFVEPTFLNQLKSFVKDLNDLDIEFKLHNIKTADYLVDLFKIKNIFGTGISTNRMENDGLNQYHIFDNFINGMPTTNILKKRVSDDQKAYIKVQLDLLIQSGLQMSLVRKKSRDVILSQNKDALHHMKIENTILEVDFKSLKYSVNFEKGFNNEELKNFKYILNHDQWKIIDFDMFMKGNDIIPRKVVVI